MGILISLLDDIYAATMRGFILLDHHTVVLQFCTVPEKHNELCVSAAAFFFFLLLCEFIYCPPLYAT